jgi:hypothetical protein
VRKCSKAIRLGGIIFAFTMMNTEILVKRGCTLLLFLRLFIVLFFIFLLHDIDANLRGHMNVIRLIIYKAYDVYVLYLLDL